MEKDSLIEQLPENYTEEVTLSKLHKSKKALMYKQINDILKATNYYELMEEFINNDACRVIEMRLSADVVDELLEFDGDEIQKAVKNPFWFYDDAALSVWGYEKNHYWYPRHQYMKKKPCVHAFQIIRRLFWIVWVLCFLFSIVGLVTMPSILTLVIVFVILFAVIIPYVIDRVYRTRGYHLSDYDIDIVALNNLPRVDFIPTA